MCPSPRTHSSAPIIYQQKLSLARSLSLSLSLPLSPSLSLALSCSRSLSLALALSPSLSLSLPLSPASLSHSLPPRATTLKARSEQKTKRSRPNPHLPAASFSPSPLIPCPIFVFPGWAFMDMRVREYTCTSISTGAVPPLSPAHVYRQHALVCGANLCRSCSATLTSGLGFRV